jgi:hypothetical protein
LFLRSFVKAFFQTQSKQLSWQSSTRYKLT